MVPSTPKPFSSVNITFLGTASAQPSSTRNHSSLALRLEGDVWLFDCGEATQHRLQQSSVKMGKIQKIFITHTHGDHIFGLAPVIASLLNGFGGVFDEEQDPRLTEIDMTQPSLEIYGPFGTRAYVRSSLAYTHSLLGKPYVVHELRSSTDPSFGDFTEIPLNNAEIPGRDIFQVGGIWENIFKNSLVSVSAAPILHSIPSVGYVVTEALVPGKMDLGKYIPDLLRTGTPRNVLSQLQRGLDVTLADGTVLHGPEPRPGRKIVILGDTCDPSPIASLAMDCDLLVHEATNAYLPGVDPNSARGGDTFESVEARARLRGHSTPQMAGAFARRVRARKLVLNHFSSRYPGNDDVNAEARAIMTAIAQLAEGEYQKPVVCARDFMSFDISLSSQES
ncbi:Metallo-hydrolase/oxidoreductase [Fistulina hepatica ATCC 64428]|nr:Metallo-hydrolase/oxidoreductase [Fistulina hepatica ATCC 64428]